MKSRLYTGHTIRALLLLALCAAAAFAQTTRFTYQGRMTDSGQHANGSYDFEFKLFDFITGGTQQGATLQRTNVDVTDGAFTVDLDFGAVPFSGADRFLEIGVRPAGSGAFTLLLPRQRITPAPYALKSYSALQSDLALNADNANHAATATSAAQLNGVPAQFYVQTDDSRMSDARNPLPGSNSYIQNRTTQQPTSNFSISGSGAVAGTLTGGIVNAMTQYNIGGARILTSLGIGNLYAGVNAGLMNMGNNNSFFGTDAGRDNANNDNSFFGAQAGSENSQGNRNSFFGAFAGRNNDGNENAFFGAEAGVLNTNGSSNSFFGFFAGRNNTTSSFNSFFGNRAGSANTTGAGNTFLGSSAGNTNTTGLSNTIIGFNADVAANNLTNANAIGARAFVEASNSLVLGSVNGKNGATADTKVGIGVTAPTANLDIESQSSSPLSLRLTNYGGESVIEGRSARGTQSSPTAIRNNNKLLTIQTNGYTGGGFVPISRARIEFTATEDWTTNDNGTAIKFFSIPAGSTLGAISMTIENGRVGVGVLTAPPAETLDVGGNIRIGFTNQTVGCVEDRDGTVIAGTCTSDLRFKKNITPFGNILKHFTRLRPVNFFWRADEFADKQFGAGQSFGLIAQEVEQVFPELVHTDAQGYKSVNYSRLPLLTVQAVRELKAEVDALSQKVEHQEHRLIRQEESIRSQQQQLAAQQVMLQQQQREIEKLKEILFQHRASAQERK